MSDRAAIPVLVTGVGDTVGQAILKALRMSAIPSRVIGTDRDELSAGLHWVDKACILPHCGRAEAYLAEMRKVCAAEQVRLIFPGSEKELDLLALHADALRAEIGAIVVGSRPDVLRVAMHKWETCRFLERAGLNFPRYARLEAGDEVERLVAECGFPLIAKPCRGTGARGLAKVTSWKEIESLRESGVEMVVQEYLQPDEEEYSVEVYTLKDGRQVGSIAYRRQHMVAGDTYKARIVSNTAVQAEAEKVAAALGTAGPCNVQLRLTERGPVTFEINPRFSGGVSLRAHFGYNEAEMALRDIVLDEPVPAPVVRRGVALRFWEELYVEEGEERPTSNVQLPTSNSEHAGDASLDVERWTLNVGRSSSTDRAMRILRTEDAAEWQAVLDQSVQHDFHHLPQYHRVAEQRGEGVAHLFAYREGEHLIALPLLLRAVDAAEPDGWKDATSVYGYGGPVASHAEMPAGVICNFHSVLKEALAARRVVAAFTRLHPLISQQDLLAGFGECRPRGETVSIDLTLPPDEQWAQYRKSCKGTINKLRRTGFVGFHDREMRYLPEFVSVYHETMRRAHARDSYFFDAAYFELMARELGPALQLFVVMNGDQVAAASLATICDGVVQDHLGGTRDEFLHASPDRLVVDTERLWAMEAGARMHHLGGGVGAQEDSVFQYKSAFSKRRHTFSTWSCVLEPNVYAELCAEKARWNESNGLRASSADYFPAYRCPAVPDVTTATAPVRKPVHSQPHAKAGEMRVVSTAQHDEWAAVLRSAVQHDFYHLAEYHRLTEDRGEGTAQLFAYRDGEYTIALPLLLRQVEACGGDKWSDATSVYGYAGPLVSHADIPTSVTRGFQEALKEALSERGVVAAFSRLHPLISQAGTLAGLGDYRPAGQTVSIDLTLPLDVQRAQYRSSTKTRINKLRRDGVVCLRDENRCHLGDFIGIYHQTMRRVNAHSSYFFDGDYFSRLASGLGPKLQLFVVTVGGRFAAGVLVTICNGIVQYHLGATGDDFLNLSPMPLLMDTVRLWANEQGARIFHLGGGVGSKEDSLFLFKAGFSDCRHKFATWRWVIVPEIYRALCDERQRQNQLHGLESVSADYFPAYRAPSVPRAERNGEPAHSAAPSLSAATTPVAV
jgi:carbamoyl-phosphate synthase large subunit